VENNKGTRNNLVKVESVHRSGVVAIVGPPNVGKSTLLNFLLGQKIAIVTPKPQTTRNRIMGIVNGPSYQILFLDTPGLHKAREVLNREMVAIAMESLMEADVVLFLADATIDSILLEKRKEEYIAYLEKIKRPSLLALNKIDLISKEHLLPIIDWYKALFPFVAIMPVSAKFGQGIDDLISKLADMLPDGPRYYPDDIPTDLTERFIVAEIIREKIFLSTREEIPYSTAVLIDSFQENESDGPVIIYATIFVERSSQKSIIIGHRGQFLKEIGISARLDIERLLDCKVVLKLWVKVKKNWTKNEHFLKELGIYQS